MTQLSLISDAKIARDRDPVTSHQAAAEITASGQRARQQTMLLGAVSMWPGRTSYELARLIPTDRFTCARRLPELRAAGLVENGPAVRCTASGKLSLTWYVRETAPKAAA